MAPWAPNQLLEIDGKPFLPADDSFPRPLRLGDENRFQQAFAMIGIKRPLRLVKDRGEPSFPGHVREAGFVISGAFEGDFRFTQIARPPVNQARLSGKAAWQPQSLVKGVDNKPPRVNVGWLIGRGLIYRVQN